MPDGWQMMPWFGMIFGPVMMIATLVIIVVVIVLIVRWFGGSLSWDRPHGLAQPRETPLEILEKRFANGEIDKEEFEERKRLLSK